ncbi:unnamed protein product [Durusdinium trenchii]|uniref:Glycoside hydrolase family 5 domain-containing protein n=1 Tax=Durusdinium trenchii TaxID=1381693 RepID=A0ABP0S8Z9_9DINO
MAATEAAAPLLAGGDDPKRITVAMGAGGERVLKLGGQEVVLLGGNYVFKTQPYFPPKEIVSANALEMAEGAKSMTYKPPPAKDGTQRVVKPCVRLGCMWEGSMPDKAGPIDPTWAANLEATIQAFAEQGVYVFLEVHDDAFSTTNGGCGLPWWTGAYMQEHVDSTSTSGHCCCCTTPSYITNPDNPLALVCECPSWLACCCCGIQPVRTTGDNPWAAYAVGTNMGNPASMNVGNLSMRLNNNDLAWGLGTLIWVSQVHNYAPRFYQSHKKEGDRQNLFEPFVQHIKFLCSKWEQHWNCVAVEVLNEPVLAGLPHPYRFMSCRRDLFDFYGALLEELDAAGSRAPLALEDGFGTLGSGSNYMKFLSLVPISDVAKKKLQQWGEKNQLIVSIHYYPSDGKLSHLSKVTPTEYVTMAKKQSAELMASSPIWLSEFCYLLPQETADNLAVWANAGCCASTYFQYTDVEYTENFGWFKYPPEVKQYGEPVNSLGIVNEKAWAAYEPTVADGTYWGGQVCGSKGGQSNVLSKVK